MVERTEEPTGPPRGGCGARIQAKTKGREELDLQNSQIRKYIPGCKSTPQTEGAPSDTEGWAMLQRVQKTQS